MTEQDIDMSADEALISALTPKAVGQIELQPFSLMRQAIATDISLPNAGVCNWFITVWVCTLAELEALKARENITQARLDAFKWAQDQGYSILHYEPVRDAYLRLTRELEVSTGARLANMSEDGQKKIDGGRPES
jgi:hypothetical protein